MTKAILLVVTLCFALSGCAGLNYNQAAPNAATFKPKTVVVLPIKMPDGMDLEATAVNSTITNAITNTKRFSSVVDPDTVRTRMSSSKKLQTLIVNYLTKLRTLGVSDKDMAKEIGSMYGADTLLNVDLTRYGYVTFGGKNYGEVGLSLKMIDSESGTQIWKAGHTRQQGYVFMKPNLDDMSGSLASYMLLFMPTQKDM